MFVCVTDLVKKHRMHPDGSMLSQLANHNGADVMTDTELGVTNVLLLVAGHETTVNLTANGMLTLLRNPWALERLRSEPDWVIPLVEEPARRAIRSETRVLTSVPRTITAVTFAGVGALRPSGRAKAYGQSPAR